MKKEWFNLNNISFSYYNFRCIYKLQNPSGKVYIGQTNNFGRRMNDYVVRRNELKSTKLSRSINKYTLSSHTLEILAYPSTQEEANVLEIFYIDFYNSFEEGLNLTKGGLGKRGIQLSKEHIQRLIEKNKNRVWTQEMRDKHAKILKNRKQFKGTPSKYKGIPRSDEVKQKISEKNKGRKMTPSQIDKRKLSYKKSLEEGTYVNNRKGIILSEETKNKISETKKNQQLKGSKTQRKSVSKTVNIDLSRYKEIKDTSKSPYIYQVFSEEKKFVLELNVLEIISLGFDYHTLKGAFISSNNKGKEFISSQMYYWKRKLK